MGGIEVTPSRGGRPGAWKRSRVAAVAVGCVAGAVGLAACSSSGASSAGAAAGAKGTVAIGGIAPLSGLLGSYGADLEAGYEQGVKDINAKGGVLGGMRLKLTMVDDAGQPAQGVSDVQTLAEQDHVAAILGTFGSATALTESATAEQLGIPNVQPLASATQMVTRGYKYLFNMYPLSQQVERQNDAVLKNTANPSSVAIVYEDEPAEIDQATVAKADWGAAVKLSSEFDQALTDFTSLTSQIKASGAQAVIFLSLQPQYIAFMTAMKQQQVNVKTVIALSSIGTDAPAQQALGATNYYAMGNLGEDPSNPAYKAFVTEWEADHGGAAPVDTSTMGYAAAEILGAAIEKAGSDKAAAIQAALASGSFPTVMSVTPVKFGSNGQSNLNQPVAQIQNGKPVELWPTAAGTFELTPPWSQR